MKRLIKKIRGKISSTGIGKIISKGNKIYLVKVKKICRRRLEYRFDESLMDTTQSDHTILVFKNNKIREVIDVDSRYLVNFITNNFHWADWKAGNSSVSHPDPKKYGKLVAVRDKYGLHVVKKKLWDKCMRQIFKDRNITKSA